MVDVVEIKVKAGEGGDGKVSFRREKFVPKGGPDGGDGGNGGSVYFVADNNMSTLIDFRSKRIYEAENGNTGDIKGMTGKSGDDLFIKVPVGTLVYEIEPDDDGKGGREVLIGDLVEVGQTFLVSKGGIGGKGNINFKSSKNRTPTQYTPGTKGDDKKIKLEIKLIADVGLVGAPNAGKSTLLNRLTNTNVKVANYPFTTLTPNLGIYKLGKDENIVIADIPGLIEGASKGKGLGDDFLRHVERTRILVHLIDPFDGEDEDMVQSAWDEYKMIRGEIVEYDHDLKDKESIVVINKIDVTEVKNSFEEIRERFKKEGIEVIGISAVSGEGLDVLMNKVINILENTPRKLPFEVNKVVKKYTIENLPNRRVVFDEGRVLTMDSKL